jgi:hypothetical protein
VPKKKKKKKACGRKVWEDHGKDGEIQMRPEQVTA